MVEKFTFSKGMAKYYRNLCSAEQKAGFMDAVIGYAFDGVEPDKSSPAYAVFPLVKPNIDLSVVRVELPPAMTYDEAKLFARQDGIPAEYLDAWLADMSGRDWEYTSRGNRVKVNKTNFRTALKSFYRQDKREVGKSKFKPSQPDGVVLQQDGYDETRAYK